MYFCSIDSKNKNEFQIFSNMKKMMILAVMMTATVSASAQSTPADPYFTSKEMPDMTKWCPGPPDTLSTAFAYDLMQYMWGKKMRNDKERADIAYRDAIFGVDYIVKEFSEPFGLQISKEDTPEIYRLLNDALAPATASAAIPSATSSACAPSYVSMSQRCAQSLMLSWELSDPSPQATRRWAGAPPCC